MNTHEKVRQTVRDRYGKVARGGELFGDEKKMGGCCDSTETSSGNNGLSCCTGSDISAEKVSSVLGYSDQDMNTVPEGANLGLGCGNPVALASLKKGEHVVDLGSGGGFDCFLSADKVGETGKVVGVDMTPDMVSKARNNAEKTGYSNVEFRLGEIEHLPVEDGFADIIMSNCVINLSPEKEMVYQDAIRVLKPGGRIAISDILATRPLPDAIKKNLELVSACIGGAATISDTEEMLEKAGFRDIKVTPKEISQDLIREWFPEYEGQDYVVSASIEAFKPVDNLPAH